jgi:hypothetical protein
MKNSAFKLGVQLGAIAASLGVSSAVTATELLNLVTSEVGMHRISYEALLEQGADLSGVKTRRIGLSVDGEPVAILSKGQDRSAGSRSLFGPGGYIEFYAQGSESQYSADQVFTLHSLSNQQISNGQRKLIRTQRNSIDSSAALSREYSHTTVEHQNNNYSFVSPIANDPYDFGFTISVRPTPTYTFALENIVGGSAEATLNAEMLGYVDLAIEGNDHHYSVEVNGLLIGDQQFDGNTVDQFSAQDVAVHEGSNTFRFNYLPLADVPFDRIALNEISVTYPRTTEMTNNSDAVDDGYLQGWFDAPQALITNVSQARVYRLDDSGEILRILGIQRNAEGVSFSTGGQAADYIVVRDDNANSGYKTPEVRALEVEQDISSGLAEYLIIAHPSLIGDELNELVAMRSEDYVVKVVDINQVYAQYGNHSVGYKPIEDYVRHATANMSTRFVVLVGNDSYDYKNFISESKSLIPTKYVETLLAGLRITQTASDASYGDVNADGVPDVAIGRIGARTKTELGYVINKIKAYQAREAYAGRLLMATDKDDLGTGVNFSADAEDLIDAMPSDWSGALRSDFRAFPEVDGHQAAHDKVINVINAGVSVVEYIGHSSQFSWAFTSPRMLTLADIPALTNVGKPAVITQWGCWNTYYVDPNGNAMGDRFMLDGEHGAVAVLGASSLTTSAGERGLGVELNKRLFIRGTTIGDALISAKQALAEKGDHRDIQLAWQILGDPALVINPN